MLTYFSYIPFSLNAYINVHTRVNVHISTAAPSSGKLVGYHPAVH